MRNKPYIITIIFIFILVAVVLLLAYFESKKIHLKFTNEKKYIIFLNTKKEFKNLHQKINKTIKKEKINCTEVKFIKDEEKEGRNYFYFILDDEYETLFEGIYTNNDYVFSYLGSNINTTAISKYSGYTYLQIINPTEYERNQDLEEIRRNGKTAPPDDTEMP